MRRLVIDLQDRRPLWRLPAWAAESIHEALPADWDAVVVSAATDSTGDGATGASAEALDAVGDAEVYLGFGVPADILRAGPGLRWVHTGTAGAGGSITPELIERDVVLTNSAGVHAPPMAETVLGMMLFFARGLDLATRAQAEARWVRAEFDRADAPVAEIDGSTVGLLGFGGIGREVANRAAALGARILAVRRRRAEPPPGVEFLYGPGGLDRLVAESDYLIVAAPETPETRGIVDAGAMDRMKPGAVLINVSRGGLVDEAALVERLAAGHLRGAGLDVFATEPLPSEHPLWRLPNALLTPHVSAATHRFWEREVELVRDNIRRYVTGEPLRNVVDTRAGY